MRLTPRLLLLVVLASANASATPPVRAPDPERGRLLLRQFGCGGCHAIPGVPAATGKVGPPLRGVARRAYLAGLLPNSRENMIRWIRAPRSIKPGTAMADMQVSEDQARDMVAYLYRAH